MHVKNDVIVRDVQMQTLDSFVSKLVYRMFERADASPHLHLNNIAPQHSRPPEGRPLPRELLLHRSSPNDVNWLSQSFAEELLLFGSEESRSARMVHSIVEYYAEHEGYRCGYCKRPDTNFSHGMWAHSLSVSDYERLLDRGWRRSGMYCYKPTMDNICCPMYTIRCRALEFKPSKSQKKIMNKMNKFLLDDGKVETEEGARERKMSTSSEGAGEGDCGGDSFVNVPHPSSLINVDSIVTSTGHVDMPAVATVTKKSEPTLPCNDASTSKSTKPGVGADKSKGPCKKAKQLRIERKLEKLSGKGVEVGALDITNRNINKEKLLEDFLEEIPEDIRNKLEVRLVRTAPPSAEWLASAAESHRLYAKYQMAVHGDPPHKCSEPKYTEFLVQSPLQEEYREGGPPCGYGSFHQQYWLKGRLVATGVIDILPTCVSSVYFFYDPSYRQLSFGTYGALRELAFVRQLHKVSPSLEHYYMGFYIHSCPKMRYKGRFSPSDLLCPESYKWCPLAGAVPKLDASPYCRLNPDLDAVDEDACRESDLGRARLLIGSTVMPFEYYRRKSNRREQELATLMEYGTLVGASLLDKLILVR